MTRTFALAVALVVAFAGASRSDDTYPVASPNERLVFELRDEGGRVSYEVVHDGRSVIAPSRIGFELTGQSMAEGWTVSPQGMRTDTEDFELPWGEQRRVTDTFTEMRALLRHEASGIDMLIAVRVFDDGVGFRFEWPEQGAFGPQPREGDDFVIEDELTEFNFPGDSNAWWIPAYFGNRYEYLYRANRLSALRAMKEIRAVHTPLTLETEDGLYVAIHEAALTDYAAMTLAPTDGGFECDLVPWSDGTKVKARTPFVSPWRVILVGESPAELVESTIVLSLNEPSRIEDTSWITPGKYAAIWWSLHIDKETWETGERHGATTANTKRMIDFAAENDLVGVLVEGWNTGWGDGWLDDGVFDWVTPTADYDLDEVARYAREKGTRMIGHLENGGDVERWLERQHDVFARFRDLEMNAVKTGYVSHGQGIVRTLENGETVKEWQHGQWMVRNYRSTVEVAAQYGIMINAHEPIKDTGIRRTWPNMMTREGARGQEYNAWSQGNGPDHTAIIPFTRLLGSPMDFTPGVMDVMIEEYKPNNRVPTTVAKQLALYVTIYSPLQSVTDLPENYAGNPAFGFIEDVPVDWEESHVLTAAIGDHFTIARKERGGDEWFLGSVTDENPRRLTVPLDFLDPDREYVAYVYADGDEAHWETRPTDVKITRAKVDASTVLRLELAAGGGTAIRFAPIPRRDAGR